MIVTGLLASPAIADNLIGNSSFEIGPGKWGCDVHRLGKDLVEYTFIKDTDIQKLGAGLGHRQQGAKDGEYALRIYSKAGSNNRSLKLTSQAIQVVPEATYSFSAWVKLDTKDIAGTFRVLISNKDTDSAHRFDNGKHIAPQTVILNRRVSIPNQWTQLKKNGIVLNANRFDFYHVTARFIPDKNNLNNDGVCWVDAIQFEQNSSAGSYSCKNPLQAGAIFTDPNHIIIRDEIDSDETMKIRFYNGGAHDVHDLPVDCKIYDLFGNPFRLDVPKFSVATGETDEATVSLNTLNKGFYRVILSLKDKPVDEKFFAILPLKRNLSPQESMAGAHMQLVDDVLRPLAKAGFHWSATLSVAGGVGRWSKVQPKASDSVKLKAKKMTHAISLARDTYGINVIGNISGMRGGFVPKWAPKETFTYKSRTVEVPTTDAYATFIRKLATAYKNGVSEKDHYISHWIIEDEASQVFSKSPELLQAYAERYAAAYSAIKAIQPDAKVAPSGRLSFVQKVATATELPMAFVNLGEESPDGYKNCNDWLAESNSGETGIWGIKREYSINPYTTYPDFERRDRIFTSRFKAKNSLAHLLRRKKYTDIHLAYDARINESRSYNMHSKSLLTFDGSLTPRAVVLASAWWMIDGTDGVDDDRDDDGVPDGDRESCDGKLYTHCFKRKSDNKYILTVISVDSPCDKMQIRIPENASGLTLYDGFTNSSANSEVISVVAADDETTVTFNELGFYVEGDNKDRLLDWAGAISNSRVKYVTVPAGRRNQIDVTKRDQLAVGPFAVTITENHNFRLFFDGEEIIQRDEMRLMPLRDYRQTADTTATTVIESEARVITTFINGTAEITRTIALSPADCSLTWRFTNHSERKQESHLYIYMNDRFRDLRPATGANWDDHHGRHSCPRFTLPPLNPSNADGASALHFDFNAVELPQGIPNADADNLQNWAVYQQKHVKIGKASGGSCFPPKESITRKVIITHHDS